MFLFESLTVWQHNKPTTKKNVLAVWRHNKPEIKKRPRRLSADVIILFPLFPPIFLRLEVSHPKSEIKQLYPIFLFDSSSSCWCTLSSSFCVANAEQLCSIPSGTDLIKSKFGTSYSTSSGRNGDLTKLEILVYNGSF